MKIFNKVLPHFEDAGILVVPHITTRPREPLTLLSEIDLSFYDGVLAVGGDGTANEVIEGLMRIPPDARPRLGIIPAGSFPKFAHVVSTPPPPNQPPPSPPPPPALSGLLVAMVANNRIRECASCQLPRLVRPHHLCPAHHCRRHPRP